MDKKKKIIVVGYPKSGNTWCARLVAELVNCPVGTFYEKPEAFDIATEGEDRISSYSVHKSHLYYSEIKQSKDIHKVIYVARDPRDVACSMSRYFKFKGPPMPLLNRIILKFGMFQSINLKRSCNVLINGYSYSNNDSGWSSNPWCEHVDPYLSSDVMVIKYEDLLSQPLMVCKIILEYLEIERDEEYIVQSIKNQSFNTVKEKFEKLGEKKKSNFLKKGVSEDYKKLLSNAQAKKIEQAFNKTMARLEYI